MRETAWVAAGFGWFFFAFSVVMAGLSVAMAADGEFAHAAVDDRPTMMLSTFLANAVAVGLIAIGKPARLVAIFGNKESPFRAVRPPNLRKRFQMAGNLRGRTRAEIVAAVGRPVAISAMPGGALIQWGETGYFIALNFSGTGDDAVCRGIASEISV